MTGSHQRDVSPGGPEAPKKYRAGTHRVVSPEETLESVRGFFPVMGITRVADITGLDLIGIPVVTVCRPNSRSVTVSLGKGLDLAAAQASGVMESVEAYMAERITLPLYLGSVNDLRSSHPLVDVGRLPRTTESLYHPDLPILWIEGQDLFTRTPRWVPYEMVHAAYTLPPPTGTGCFVATSNGLASGNHFLEAISHAICEVVERDAATLHSVRRPEETASRRIDLRTVDDSRCGEALDRLDQAGMAVTVWDITTDIGVPAFRCRIAERHPYTARVPLGAEGMGCHPDRSVALLRALTEAVQDRLASISGGRDEVTGWDYAQRDEPEPWPEREPYLAGEPVRDFTAIPGFDSDSFDADVRWEVSALRSADISEVVAVDLTREEFGIPVVRVIVPGLEGPTTTVRSCRLGQAGHGADQRPMSDIYVFLGPTLAEKEARAELDASYLPPVSAGDVYRLWRRRPRVIGVVDGYFDRVPAVWHKEIMWIMERGVHVFGCAGLGALRAAELDTFGMRGVGWVYQAFRDGTLDRDDEVAVRHGAAGDGYRALSEAMVNIRRTLQAAAHQGIISAATRDVLTETGTALCYQDRTWPDLLRAGEANGVAAAELDVLRRWLPVGRIDQQADDAVAMLRGMRAFLATDPVPQHVDWSMARTTMWEAAKRLADTLPGDGAAGSALLLEGILDEIRLLGPGAFEAARRHSLLRVFAADFAEREGMTIDGERQRDAVAGFKRMRDIEHGAEFARFLAGNGLSAGDFERLVAVNEMARWACGRPNWTRSMTSWTICG